MWLFFSFLYTNHLPFFLVVLNFFVRLVNPLTLLIIYLSKNIFFLSRNKKHLAMSFRGLLPRFNLMIISFFFFLPSVCVFFFIYKRKVKITHTQAENICRLIQWRVVPSLSLFRYIIVFLINNLMMIYPTKKTKALFFLPPLALFNSFAVVDKETWINLKK